MRSANGHPVLARFIDVAMSPLAKLRPRLVAQAKGHVLEIGVGTGLNFRHYGSIDSLCGIEPDPHMLVRAKARAQDLPFAVELLQAGAEALPFDDGRFDTVLATWVFCTIPEAERAAQEVFRVLKPGGRLVFIEHVHSTHGPSRAVQHAIDPIWQRVGGGCHLTRDPVALFEAAGLSVQGARYWGSESWTLTPMLRGDAVKPSNP